MALCTSGLEGAVCKELKRMGFKILKVTAGHVHFFGQMSDVPKLNLTLRSAERVLIEMAEFEAKTFDDLFDGTFSASWQDLIHSRATLVIEKVKVRNSKLSATGAVASVVKKAIYEKIGSKNDPDGTIYPLYVYLKNDTVSLLLDTTGPRALSKRGYRLKTSTAPLRETIAAGLIIVSDWDEQKLLLDPFCGSGTICIEAARMALGILNDKRTFAFQSWPIFADVKMTIHSFGGTKNKMQRIALGFDRDPSMVRIARENAVRASVAGSVEFSCKRFEELEGFKNVHVITNPPYGIRLKEIDRNFLAKLAKLLDKFADSKICVLSPADLERILKIKASKKLRFQNSGIWTWYYIFEPA
ncbi:MAG: putative N6-adenine-specific methylase [Pseudothermotoga sp.]|uniref:THUMP domain-containing class I SAM-dependent RNA methyltransferase n=1 Tax=Pseudothermotoga sp. TaxID=2033661 RepID=UPI000B0FAB27|nr:putative N6-adenine-specific methylase [Pseudothermotoga sp.]